MPLEAQAAPAAAGQERALVDSCRSGDPVAFARLVQLHEGMVFSLSARLLGNPEEARDVAQEVFLQVYRQLGRFEGRSALRTWIYRITVNQCHNRRRFWHRRHRDREEGLEGVSVVAATARGGESPYDEARRQ